MSFLQKGVPLLLIEYCELCEGFEVIVLRVQTTTGSYHRLILLFLGYVPQGIFGSSIKNVYF